MCFLFIINGTNLLDGFKGVFSINLIIINLILTYIILIIGVIKLSIFIFDMIFIYIDFLYFILSYYSLSGQSLFTNLSADQTGVTFQNTITDEKAHNILIYSNYYGGGGVGIGDFNQDGLADLFFAGNQVGDQLYLNKGNLQFENITQKAGILNNGGWSSGVVLADVNNDGKLDIYVTRELYDDQPELRKNALYINKTAAKSNQLSFV